MGNQNQARIQRIPLGRANAYLVISGREVLLIDTGEKRKEKKILQALKSFSFSPDNIRLIILTHTHYDHCGSAMALKEMTGAKIVVHHSEAICLKAGYGGFPKGTNLLTKAIAWMGSRIGKRMGGYAPASPDITISERFGLEDYGTDGYILPTPGHTSGSVSVIVSNRHALVGDTLFNVFKKNLFPPFADDQEELVRSWEKLFDTGCDSFYPGHGKPFERDKFRQSLEAEKKAKGIFPITQ